MEEAEAEFVVGTYQEFIIGYKLIRNSDEDGDQTFTLKQSFTNHAHAKSVRGITSIGKYVASGSADETIKLINLQTRAEHGTLQPQTGTITCLASFGSNYLFSGSQDGSICIWKSGSWRCEKTFKGAHDKGVLGLSIHPSGKLAMSIGEDKSLKTWNLIKGRKGFVTNLYAVADSIQFSPEGTLYAVGVSNRVDIYSLETAKVIYSIPFGKRASCLCFVNEETLIVGGDQESIEVHNISKSKKLTEFKAHKNRVKDMKYLHSLEALVTASNDGFIKVWSFSKNDAINFSSPPTLVAEADTTCRIICLAVWTHDLVNDAEESSSEAEEVSEEEEEEVDEETAEIMRRLQRKKQKLKEKKAKMEQMVSIELPKVKVRQEKKTKKNPKRKSKVTVEADSTAVEEDDDEVSDSSEPEIPKKKLKRNAELNSEPTKSSKKQKKSKSSVR